MDISLIVIFKAKLSIENVLLLFVFSDYELHTVCVSKASPEAVGVSHNSETKKSSD